jgi:hypothetical protein
MRRELGIPLDAPCIGIAGNIQEWKGQRVVIEALGLLADRRRALRHRRRRASRRRSVRVELRAHAELGLGSRVHSSAFAPTFPSDERLGRRRARLGAPRAVRRA